MQKRQQLKGDNRLESAVFRYVEHELYNYDWTKNEIREMREDILNSTNAPELKPEKMGKYMSGDVTFSKVARLTSNVALIRMQETVMAIEKALKLLSEQHAEVFEYKYRQNMDYRRIVMEMPTSQDTYFRKRRELVRAVAVQMGLMNP